MGAGMYILDRHEAVEENDTAKWSEWFQKADRIVKKTEADISLNGTSIGTVKISTVFLGIDHSFDEGFPILFETMVFGGALNEEIDRCSTWEGAEKMHELMCEKVKNSINNYV